MEAFRTFAVFLSLLSLHFASTENCNSYDDIIVRNNLVEIKSSDLILNKLTGTVYIRPQCGFEGINLKVHQGMQRRETFFHYDDCFPKTTKWVPVTVAVKTIRNRRNYFCTGPRFELNIGNCTKIQELECYYGYYISDLTIATHTPSRWRITKPIESCLYDLSSPPSEEETSCEELLEEETTPVIPTFEQPSLSTNETVKISSSSATAMTYFFFVLLIIVVMLVVVMTWIQHKY